MLNLCLDYDKSVEPLTWQKVMAALEDLKQKGGGLRLRNASAKTGEPTSLYIEADKHDKTFQPVLGIEGGNPRHYENRSVTPEVVDFSGRMDVTSTLTDDFDLIVKMTKEFYDTGDVKGFKEWKDLFFVVENLIEDVW